MESEQEALYGGERITMVYDVLVIFDMGLSLNRMFPVQEVVESFWKTRSMEQVRYFTMWDKRVVSAEPNSGSRVHITCL